MTRPRAVLAVVLTSYALIVLDISIVITALPGIQDTLGFSDTSLSWVQNAYLLAFGGLLLLGARAGDLFGRRRMFSAGLALFSVASVIVGVAQSEAVLIGARALQGVGAAVLAPSTLAMLQTSFAEGPTRTRALSLYAATAGVASTLGLVIGGLFAGWLSWRVGFVIKAPIGAVLLLVVPHVLPETTPRSGQSDVVGALTSVLGMVALVFGVVRSADAGWGDAGTLGCVAGGLVLLVLFVRNERRVDQPIMPLRLFAARERFGAYAVRLLFLAAMAPFYYFTTQYLQGVAGYDPVQAGLAFLPTTLANFAGAIGVTRVMERHGTRAGLILALLVSIVGLAWLSRLSADTSYLTGIAPAMLLIGLGQGAGLAPLTSAGMAGVSAEDAGAAGGVTNVAHQVGGSIGLAVLVTVFAAAGSDSLSGAAGLAHQISAALTAGTLLTVAALVVTLGVLRPPSPEPQGATA